MNKTATNFSEIYLNVNYDDHQEYTAILRQYTGLMFNIQKAYQLYADTLIVV